MPVLVSVSVSVSVSVYYILCSAVSVSVLVSVCILQYLCAPDSSPVHCLAARCPRGAAIPRWFKDGCGGGGSGLDSGAAPPARKAALYAPGPVL